MENLTIKEFNLNKEYSELTDKRDGLSDLWNDLTELIFKSRTYDERDDEYRAKKKAVEADQQKVQDEIDVNIKAQVELAYQKGLREL